VWANSTKATKISQTRLNMMDLTYSFRINRRSVETVYRQDHDALRWTNARGGGHVTYTAIRKVRVYKVRYFGSRATYWRCDLRDVRGRKIRLQAAHYAGHGRIDDRTATYIPFIKQLESRISAANPAAAPVIGGHWVAVVDAAVGLLLVGAQKATRFVSLDRAAGAAAWFARQIGPRLKGHRLVRDNLVAAYPEKSPHEIERILLGMWDNLGRVFVEYGHLDRLWDFDPGRAQSGRVVIEGEDRRRYQAIMDSEGPGLIFGAHFANWELPIWGIGAHPKEIAIVYHPSKIAAIDRELGRIRARSKAGLIPANAQAPFIVKDLLRRRGGVGFLVDEHFPRGIDVMFFGRPCKVTPMFGRFARQFDCPIYGGRAVRLPGGRFRIELTDPLPAPRDADGKIDIAGTMQMITGVIEGWVRESPEQWLWLQRRWR
jgi:Kdo2-lipid IVA lauroyltransferase/acyltransferase